MLYNFVYSIFGGTFMTYHDHSKDDEGFGGCILAIALFFAILLLAFLFGSSTVSSKKEIIVENSNLTSYTEAAEKLKLSYKIKNSGDKKKIIISFSE